MCYNIKKYKLEANKYYELVHAQKNKEANHTKPVKNSIKIKLYTK